MFDVVEQGRQLSKAEYKQQEEHFRTELLKLQRDLADANIATLIMICGVEGSGKGDVVDNLNKWFDSRGMETHAFWDETDEETQRPEYWRYWKRLPARGSIATMFGGWYWDPIYDRAEDKLDEAAFKKHAQRIIEFERMLVEDGLLIIKLWFHLSKKVFKQRIAQRSTASYHIATSLSTEDTNKHYKKFTTSAGDLLSYTNTPESPWMLIESDDVYSRNAEVAHALLRRISQRLNAPEDLGNPRSPEFKLNDRSEPVLAKVDLNVCLDNALYKKELKSLQRELAALSWQAYDQKRSTVIVFEGWDAAGKGGAIRRITRAMDARLYRGISVGAPSDEELAHHYLWRFWRQIPRAGYITLYDRSWYGRVLVERVEGLASDLEWQRAYQEINDFETQLFDHGVVLIKFWLHISPEEQLRRFEHRQTTPWKQHKLTDEDRRNREKWQDYTDAVNDMLLQTNTKNAPWHVIPANDKYFARVDVLRVVTQHMAKMLERFPAH